MTNRGKFLQNRQGNRTNTPKNFSTRKDDDNCSVVCYKDSNNGQVNVVRIRQQIFCALCNSMRGTLLLYCKHILDNKHRDNTKKLCDENRFTPTVYEQAIHLAFYNNFCYQSEKFHFRYNNSTEESNSISQSTKTSVTDKESAVEKMEINNQSKSTPTNLPKQQNIQVTLVFQDKTYSRTGMAIAQIREELLKDMIADRATDIAALPADIYYAKKNLAPDDAYYNIPNSSVKLTMAEEQSQVMLKKQQQPQEPFKNGQMSSAENSKKDNDVEQTTAMTIHETLTAGKLDVDEQSSVVDDVMNVCKDVLDHIIVDVYSKCDEFKRERELLFGIARRRFKRRKAFFCDLCLTFLTTEEACTEHRNGREHLEKIRLYQTDFLPWRRAMQKSLITGKSMKEIMGNNDYDNYKATMALYLAPNNLHIHERFCCAYCERVFPDQWILEKHLHTAEHKDKQACSNQKDHKELVVRFADVVILPTIYKLNGMKDLSDVPDDIKKEQGWSFATRKQLDDDTASFLQNYPFDQFEGVTNLSNNKVGRKKRSSVSTASTQKPRNNNITARNQQGKHGGFNRPGRGRFPMAGVSRGTAVKRSFPTPALPVKRFRPDLNNSYSGATRGSGPMRNYEMNQYHHGPSAPYNNGNDRWTPRFPVGQQQQRPEFFERSTFETRPVPPNNNGYYGSSSGGSLYPMPGSNNYDDGRQPRFNSSNGAYGNQQSNYNPHYNRPVANPINDYYPEQNSSLLVNPNHRSHHQASTGPINEFVHYNTNNLQQSSRPPIGQVHHPNQSSFGGFGVHNSNNTNPPIFSSSVNQQQNQMGTNGPSVRSYADYRASSGLPTVNSHSSTYPPLSNTQNPNVSQPRTFDEFGLSAFTHGPSNSFGRANGSSFGNEESRYGTYGHQNQMEQLPQPPWRGSSNGVNNMRGRGGRPGQFQSTNKQPGSTFSYRSSNTNNNNNNGSVRGRGMSRNARNFGRGR